MNKIASVVLVATLGLGSGCSKKKPEEGLEPAPPPPAAGSAAPAKPFTAEDAIKRVEECWGFWNALKYDDFKGCFTDDSTSEAPGLGMPPVHGAAAIVNGTKMLRTALPDLKGEFQLELINGHNVAYVVLLSGTQTAPLAGPMGTIPVTNKKVGILVAQTVEMDDTGHAKRELDYFDMATLLGQLGPAKDHPARAAIDKLPMPKEVVIARGDDREKANLVAAQAMTDAFNKHDAKAFADSLTDDAVWSEQPEAKDWDKKETVAQATAAWKAFSDLKINPSSSWAAGDYVVVVATMEGTNDAPMPAMGIKAKTGKKIDVPFVSIQKLDKGKVKQTWIFDQGLAFATQLGLLPPPPPAGTMAPGAGSASTGSAAK